MRKFRLKMNSDTNLTYTDPAVTAHILNPAMKQIHESSPPNGLVFAGNISSSHNSSLSFGHELQIISDGSQLLSNTVQSASSNQTQALSVGTMTPTPLQFSQEANNHQSEQGDHNAAVVEGSSHTSVERVILPNDAQVSPMVLVPASIDTNGMVAYSLMNSSLAKLMPGLRNVTHLVAPSAGLGNQGLSLGKVVESQKMSIEATSQSDAMGGASVDPGSITLLLTDAEQKEKVMSDSPKGLKRTHFQSFPDQNPASSNNKIFQPDNCSQVVAVSNNAVNNIGGNLQLLNQSSVHIAQSAETSSCIVSIGPPPTIQTSGSKLQQQKLQPTQGTVQLPVTSQAPFAPNPQPTKNKTRESFSVAAFLREMTSPSSNSKERRKKPKPTPGQRGRRKKDAPKIINEQKLVTNLRKEFGIRDVKKLGLLEEEYEKEPSTESVASEDPASTDELPVKMLSRTRSGRLSRPPVRIVHNLKLDVPPEIVDPPPTPDEPMAASVGPVTNMATAAPPVVDSSIISTSKRNYIPDAKYLCKVCGKCYLGTKKINSHLRNFPDHGFATPEPPPSPSGKKPTFNIDSWVSETEVGSILDLVGPKIFQSFSLWDLLTRKVSAKNLGTAGTLSSILADIQALVMDVKNLVEQCLTNIKPSDSSLSVSLSPMMSNILGQSNAGGGERFVLPSNQVPTHYHKLLGFPAAEPKQDVKTLCDVLSPDSTNSIFHPEEDNSQMSLSSDTLDSRPLGDKVVLEENLGTARADIDEETQDSGITGPSVIRPRPRLGSESQSVTPPPPSQTPDDFLNQEDDNSLLSPSPAIENAVKASTDDPNCKDAGLLAIRTTASNVHDDSFTSSAKLPSFSSIMSGVSKDDCHPNDVMSVCTSGDVRPSDTMRDSLLLGGPADCGHTMKAMMTTSTTLHVDNSAQAVGGSAPVSPGIDYVRTIESMQTSGLTYTRRSSVDQVLLNKSLNDRMIVSEMCDAQKLVTHAADMFHHVSMSVPCGNLVPTDHNNMVEAVNRGFSFAQASPDLADMMTKESTIPSIVTSPFQSASDNAVFNVTSSNVFTTQQQSSGMPNNFLHTPPKIEGSPVTMMPNNFSDMMGSKEGIININKMNVVGKEKPFPNLDLDSDQLVFSKPNHHPSVQKIDSIKMPKASDFDCSTHVTYSGELNHPIPSVSPFKDPMKGYDGGKRCHRQTPPMSQSPNLFSDLESVLGDADFTFHSALSVNADNPASKTPEKLLTSVPPSVIMTKKSPSSLLFDSFDDFVKEQQHSLPDPQMKHGSISSAVDVISSELNKVSDSCNTNNMQ